MIFTPTNGSGGRVSRGLSAELTVKVFQICVANAAAAEIVRKYRRRAPKGFDPLNLVVTVTPGKVFAAGEIVETATLNQLGQPTFSISGTLATSEIADGAVTAPKATPGPWFWATSTSGAGALATTKYTLSWGTNTAPAGLVDGLEVWFKCDAANTGTVSLDVGTGGEKVARKHKSESLEAGDLRANMTVGFRYGTAAGEWQMISQLANRPSEYLTASGTDTYVITPSPAYALIADVVGRRFAIKFTNANTGASTLNANGLGALAIKKNKDQALVAGDIKAGQIIEVILDDASPKVWQMQGQIGNAPIPSAITGDVKNLLIVNNSTTAIDFSADEIVVKDSTNNIQVTVATGGTITVDPATSGANGIDTGGVAANTWYYLWCIYDRTNNLVKGLCSLSSTAPTMPSGYTYKALIGRFRCTGTGPTVLATLFQRDKEVMITDTNIFSAKACGTINTWQVLSGADLTALQTAVPPDARFLIGTMGKSSNAAYLAIATSGSGTAAGVGAVNHVGGSTSAFNSFVTSGYFRIAVPSGGLNFAWRSLDTTADNRINVTGYEL